jgi:hypothetical protein
VHVEGIDTLSVYSSIAEANYCLSPLVITMLFLTMGSNSLLLSLRPSKNLQAIHHTSPISGTKKTMANIAITTPESIIVSFLRAIFSAQIYTRLFGTVVSATVPHTIYLYALPGRLNCKNPAGSLNRNSQVILAVIERENDKKSGRTDGV